MTSQFVQNHCSPNNAFCGGNFEKGLFGNSRQEFGNLLKPDKVKHFQEKERSILEQNLSRPSSQEFARGFEFSSTFFSNKIEKSKRIWSPTNLVHIEGSFPENNVAGFSSDALWKKNDAFSRDLLLPTPTSAIKKKGSTSSSSRKQKGKTLLFNFFAVRKIAARSARLLLRGQINSQLYARVTKCKLARVQNATAD